MEEATSSTRNASNGTGTGTGGIGSSAGEAAGQSNTVSQSQGSSEQQQQQQPTQSSSLSSSTTLTSAKVKPQKLCQVCGDKAKSFHFGGLSCDSCKAFFRRSVHNDAYKGFHCVYKNTCEITVNSRKSCQFCRFQKCLKIGMEINWVMTEEERSQLQKQRNEKKAEASSPLKNRPSLLGSKSSTTSQSHASLTTATTTDDDNNACSSKFEPNIADMLKFMTIEERDEIESIVIKYQHSYREIPFQVAKFEGNRNSVEIIKMFTTILRRFAYFTKLIPEFNTLSLNDQSALLRAGVLEMCLLRSALAFDMKNNRWPKTENMEFLKDCPQLRVEDMEKLVSKDLYHMHMQFINGIQELNADEPTVMILLLIVLFYPERGPLEQQEHISKIQEKYLLLLNKYVQWRYGPLSNKIFPKLLTRLADLRQLNDFHTEYNLRMSKTEVEEIQEQLGNINLNPYPQWVLVEDQQRNRAAASASAGGGGPTSSVVTAGNFGSGIQQHNAFSYAEEGNDEFGELQMRYQEEQQHYSMQQQQQAARAAEMQQMHGHGPIPTPTHQQLAQGHGHGHPEMPSMRQLFMQFVSQKIPTLIADPFAVFPMEQELANATALFQQLGPQAQAAAAAASGIPNLQSLFAAAGSGSGPAAFQQQVPHSIPTPVVPGHGYPTQMTTGHQQQQHAASGSGGISQICNILESSDPNTLKQLKDNLSPTVVAKLSAIFGSSTGTDGGSSSSASSAAMQSAAADFLSGNLDFSKISPELINSFLSGGGSIGSPAASGVPGAIAPGMSIPEHYQQHLSGQGPMQGYPSDTMAGASTNYPQPQVHLSGNWVQQHHHEIRTSPNEPSNVYAHFSGHHSVEEGHPHYHGHGHDPQIPTQQQHPQFEHSPNPESPAYIAHNW